MAVIIGDGGDKDGNSPADQVVRGGGGDADGGSAEVTS
jgi:hypothetical protein